MLNFLRGITFIAEFTTATTVLVTTSTTTEIPPDCIQSPFGCCPDNYTAAHGLDNEGCCLSSPFGCCPDHITDAQGPNFQGND